MRLWIFYLITFINCMVAPGYAENSFPDEICEVLNYRSKLDRGDWLPVKMTFPEHYVVLPADRNKEIGLDPGFFCGERSTIKDLWQQYEKDPKANLKPISGFFYVSWSWDIAQKDSKTFSISDQEIRSMLEKQGATSVNICNLYWNDFPVKSVEAELSHSHAFIAWIGLNTGGEAIKIQYFCPEHTSLFAEECAVWNQFLHKSTGLSYDEYSNCVKRELESMFKAIDKKERFP